MNKLEFPQGFDIISELNTLYESNPSALDNYTALIRFYDFTALMSSLGTYKTAIELDYRDKLYKAYVPTRGLIDVSYRNATGISEDFTSDDTIEFTGTKQWDEINNISSSITIDVTDDHLTNYIYLLDLEGNILTAISEYNENADLNTNTVDTISFNGFTITKNAGYYNSYNDSSVGNITFKYTGNPEANNIFYGYIVLVKNVSQDINNNSYYVFRLKLENTARVYPYTSIKLYFKYSTATPTIDYTTNSDMMWSNRIGEDTSNKPVVNISYDYNGNLKQDSVDSISVCKFSAYLNLNLQYIDETSVESNPTYRDTLNWVTVANSTILNLNTFTFLVSSNTGIQRENDVILYDDTGLIPAGYEEAEGYLRKILTVHITQDASPLIPDEEYDFYTIQYNNGGESTLDLNTNLNLLITPDGNHIGTYLSENLGTDYTILITKKRHTSSGDTLIPFIDNNIVIDTVSQSTWVTVTKTILNGKLQIVAEAKLKECPQGISRSNIFNIKENNNAILNIKVSQSNIYGDENTEYFLYSKEQDREGHFWWELIAIDNTRIPTTLNTIDFNYEGIPISRYENDELLNIREYALVCKTIGLQLSLNDINIHIDNEKLPYVTTEKTEILPHNDIDVITDNQIINGEVLQFTVTYTVTSNLLTHIDQSKYILLQYLNFDYLLVGIHIMQRGVPIPEGSFSANEDDSSIWDVFKRSSNYVSCIDNGEGINVDPTSLLYKGSTANIYKTIEAKDSRLFLGNYETPKLYTLAEVKGIEIFNDLENPLVVKEGWYYLSSDLRYDKARLDSSSYDERMLKFGESYLLGIVFIYKTGLRSNVYVFNNTATEDGTFTLTELFYSDYKKYFYVTMTSDALKDLNKAGIAAVIPVRAINTSFKTIALGIGVPTILINDRQLDNKVLLSYLYRLHANINDFQNNFIVDSRSNNGTTSWYIKLLDLPNTNYNKVTKIITVNTPEMDCTEDLTLHQFNCKMKQYIIPSTYETAHGTKNTTLTSLLNVHLQIDSKYVNSHQIGNGALWYGFLDNNNGSIDALNDLNNYKDFNIYVWNREIVGGEWPAAKIRKKVFVYNGSYSYSLNELEDPNNDNYKLYNKVKCYNYRNYDYPELLNIANTEQSSSYSYLYLGNVDYTISSEHYYNVIGVQRSGQVPYYVMATNSENFKYTRESGIDNEGKCYAPLWVRYKSSPHLVVDLNSSNIPDFNYSIVELSQVDPIVKDESTKIYSQWIKCGPIVSTSIHNQRPLRFAAGDWFYGNYECLRTYPYSSDDPNLLVEVFKVPLMSKVNLALRADTNKGSATSYLSPVNFNLFNPVYNQEDNFFTYSYLPNNISYGRNFLNTVLWSSNKQYGAETDEWCHILNINSLDLDGDKGEITSLEKYNGMLIAFLTTGISLILFNDNVQISANDGSPIEIANSGIVNGKRYLQDRIGCLNRESISNSPKALYFIDSINKSIYSIGSEGVVTDICYTAGMKSWALNNLNKDWWSYYDVYSQEVLFANGESCIAYNDMLLYFPCFLSYEKVKNILSLNGRTYLFNYDSNKLWKKNSINENKIFNTKVPIEVEIIANPEPTEDKTFETIEYRADGFTEYNELDLFSKDTIYNPTVSFDDIRVTNEYQDTDTVSLYKSADKNTYQPNSNLQKKFRIWRIQIPRVAKSLLTSTTVYKEGLDRIRNPWCKIKLTTNMNNFKKLLVHDFAIKYTK